MSLALLVLTGVWTKARGLPAWVIAGSAAIAATEAAERIIGWRWAMGSSPIGERECGRPWLAIDAA